MPKTYTLNPCKCGGIPQFTEGYDTLQVACPKCGASTRNYVGDCHDEALMLQTYGQGMEQSHAACAALRRGQRCQSEAE